MKTLELKKGLFWTGCLDPGLKVFDIIMNTEFGTSYNSYLLKGSEKTAIFETAKAKCMNEYMDKLSSLVDIKDIDYLIVNHTEPDHAGSAKKLIGQNPGIKLVGTATAIRFMKEITNIDFTSVIVKEGDILSLGDKTLHFITAPNLHWPDAMYTYIEENKTLITCDSFGCHYSLEDVLISKLKDWEGYNRALKYYFDNIMGPFKPYVLKGINKIKDLDIDLICPGHGPVLDEDPWKVVNSYKEWATEVNPNSKKTVIMPYVAAYGYTKELADKITEGIKAAGDIDVKLYDMVEADQSKVLDEMYWADGLLFGTPTIVGEALKPIWDLTTSIFPGTHGGKIAGAFGSYGWSGEGVPHIMERLKQLRMKLYGEGLRVQFKPSQAQLEEAFEYGYGFGLSVLKGKVVEAEEVFVGKRYWKCLVCGEIVEGIKPPDACPVCGVGPEQFVPYQVDDVTYQSQKDESFIVLGGGIAALSAATEIRKRNKVAKVEIISDEEVFCYNRPMLTKGILSDFDAINFFTNQKDWYDENKIKCTLGKSVTKIDLVEHKVILGDESERAYDKLIYATGAECNRPPMKGGDKENVYVIRKLADANVIRDRLHDINKVVIIGGGVLGLEAAWEFKRAGKEVAIVERSSGIMKNQLDEEGALLLKAAVESTGVKVFTNANMKEILDDGVKLSDQKVNGDIVIISAGIKPNSALGVGAGLDGDRWITVDDKMQTSDSDVFAAGDVAVLNGTSIAIWSQALEMGKVAGINAVGDESKYKPVTPSNVFEGFGIELFSIGDNGKKDDLHYKEIELSEPAKGIYKKMYFVNNRFAGGILIGAQNLVPKMLKAYEQKLQMKDTVEIL